ncbi:hypothetical protein RhiirA5_442856 [Rhizophagus irregularis]|uniref:Uncharacterized protein n=1 Tax=Rhizophagus irregularis TaxID=588596 RepID=A0A2N0NEF4_9GLOM|nr:hypothetical protein RhiirA5_442856 [Rhizophagus irregularis]
MHMINPELSHIIIHVHIYNNHVHDHQKTIQDAELEVLLEYNSAEEFSDTDRLNNRDFLSLNGISNNEYKIKDIAEEEEEKEEEKEEEEDTMKLYVGKTFHNWDHVVNFMKKYAATKDHGVRISGKEKVDKITQEITNEYTCIAILKKLSLNHQKDKLHLAKLNVHGE